LFTGNDETVTEETSLKEEVYNTIKSFGEKGTHVGEVAKTIKAEYRTVNSIFAELFFDGRLEDLGKHPIDKIFISRFYRVKEK